MPAAPASPAQSLHMPARRRIPVLSVALVVLASLVAAAILFARSRWWPFSEEQVLKHLREASDSQVQVRNFQKTYFPAPGCILQGLTFLHSTNEAEPTVSIEKLKVEGSYLGMISQRISRIVAEGIVVSVPTFGSGENTRDSRSKINADDIMTNIALLEFATQEPDKIVRFDVHDAQLRNVGRSAAFSYRVKFHNPEPPGEVTAEGKFGPWIRDDAGETQVSGEYRFENADLSVYGGIAGSLASTGKFSGKLSHIDISGTADVPDFEVVMGHHPAPLITSFSAYVDATRGTAFLERVDADLRRTRILAQGSIATSANGKGKTVLIDAESTNARIEDLLGLFVASSRPPMSGTAAIHAHIEIPPGEEFLKNFKMSGTFGVGPGKFTDPSTQKDVDQLSAGARGENKKEKEDPETALANLEGRFDVANATAEFPDLFFQVPGARVRLHGAYNLLDYKIDLRGQMSMDSKISNAATGAKALLLKVMDPVFKKTKTGEIVPVRISGTFEHPRFGLDLNDKKHTSKDSFSVH